jgi:predicted outer membrane repeat protein
MSSQSPRRMRHTVASLSVIGMAAGSLLAGMTVLAGVGVTASGASTNLYVATTGSDGTNNCQSASAPCLTLTHAMTKASNGDTINLGSGTFVGNVEINKSVTIAGTAPTGSLSATNTTISAQEGEAFVLGIPPGKTVTISNLVISGLNQVGGGIDNDGALTLDDVSVVNNTGSCCGSGIANFDKLLMNGGSVTGNTATEDADGGGIANFDSATLNGVTFTHNSATGSTGEGGAIYNDGSLHLTGSTAIHNNSATLTGGGVEECPTATLTTTSGVSITDNTPNDVNHTDPQGSC